MRITRETLLKIARDTAAQRGRADRRVICIYLTGSLRRDDPLLGGTADIDLYVVHDSQPPAAREIVRLSDEVHLDIAHVSDVVFRQPRHLRADPWVGGYLCDNPVILYDTQHWFEFTQASVNAQFYRPDYVFERATPLAEGARQAWLSLHSGAVSPGPQKIMLYLSALEKAANAIACLTGVPLTERRFLLTFPQRTQAIKRPGLAAGLVDLIVSQPLTEETWSGWVTGWKAAYSAVNNLETCPPRLHACRRGYYERAASSLREEHPEAAIWLLFRTWTLALVHLPEEAGLRQPWEDALQALGLDEENLPSRLEVMDAYLDSVEETLDMWAKSNGV
jgi:hypothetical protein